MVSVIQYFDRFRFFFSSCFLVEYQELTSKLHELETKELELERLQQPEEPETESICGTTSSQLTRQPKIFLRAHLPNQQRTSVQVMPGLRLRDALFKALNRRDLTSEMCEVNLLGGDFPIPWDTDISLIRSEEVYVKVVDKFPVMSHISHQFIRKTFFSLAFCECCRRLLFTGFYCNQCNYRFHQRCADKVPPTCHKIRMDSYYQLLLAQGQESTPGILHSGVGGMGYQTR